MNTRPFGNLGFNVVPFGLGCMRLPSQPDSRDDLLVDESVALIRRAMDGGVNYLDTAYVYAGGNSERVLGIALKNGYREKVKIATKLPLRDDFLRPEGFDKLFFESLRRLDVEYVDFYLLHGINGSSFDKFVANGALKWLDKKVEQGLIRYPSFSFHGEKEDFVRILDTYPFKMAQIQMNILDTQHQATMDGLVYAGKKGVPIVIMEPLRGGALAGKLPDNVQKAYEPGAQGRSLVEWAFRFLYDRPEVAVILSGCSTIEQVEDNLRIFKNAEPNCLTAEDKAYLRAIADAYNARPRTGCTACRYCMPCPFGVDIPGVFRSVDQANMFDNVEMLRAARNWMGGKWADACTKCGACEKKCPQHLPIRQLLAKAADDVL
ncbi:MAG: aldo/keto reductase [Christensenellales bacterium]|jgi:predicted aldo/keto reductase-like oxidoreductase